MHVCSHCKRAVTANVLSLANRNNVTASMNRRFPGTPDGSVAAQLAYFVTCHLIPIAGTVFDLHTGGSSINFTPMATFKGSEWACPRRCCGGWVLLRPCPRPADFARLAQCLTRTSIAALWKRTCLC